MRNEIVEFSRQILEKVNELDNIIDSYTDDIKDLTDTASDLLKPIKAFKSIYDTARKIKFKRFLKSYAKGFENSFNSTDDLTTKLTEYLKLEKNLNFVYDTIDSALNSKSVKCSGILGYFASKILSKQIDLNVQEMIYVNALRNLNDFELKFTIEIIENVEDWSKNQTIALNGKFLSNKESYEYTVQKLKGLQVVREIFGSPGNPVNIGQSFWGTYRLNDISKGFYDLIRESGFYDEIRNQ